jgi:hypothetical protein
VRTGSLSTRYSRRDSPSAHTHPEHLRKQILQTLFGRMRSGQRLIDAAHPSHFHPCDFLAARFQLGPCVFCFVTLLFQFGDKGLDLLLMLLIGCPG